MGRITHKAYRSKSGGRIMPQIQQFIQNGYGNNNMMKRVNEPAQPPPADPNTPQNLNTKPKY